MYGGVYTQDAHCTHDVTHTTRLCGWRRGLGLGPWIAWGNHCRDTTATQYSHTANHDVSPRQIYCPSPGHTYMQSARHITIILIDNNMSHVTFTVCPVLQPIILPSAGGFFLPRSSITENAKHSALFQIYCRNRDIRDYCRRRLCCIRRIAKSHIKQRREKV